MSTMSREFCTLVSVPIYDVDSGLQKWRSGCCWGAVGGCGKEGVLGVAERRGRSGGVEGRSGGGGG